MPRLRASVATSLAGDLPDHSWWQATTGVTVGGLGLRTAVTVALPAFVASRILSRPLVVTMVDHLCAAIGASRQTIMAEYDARTDEALSRLASTLPTATALDLLAKLDEAYAESHLSWQNVLSGSEPAMRDQPPPAPRHARGITPDDGDGDHEHPHTRKRTKIQGVITAYIDSGVREGLLQMHESEGSWAARMRLAALGDSSVDHTWLWRLNPRHGSTLEADEYVDSVRFRLGCAGPAEPTTCAACNSGILDTGAAHASCCALGEATRGHNAVSSLIHAAAQQCDHTSEMEVPGLIPGTDLRPADVLTSALGNAYTALDVSICSPHASEAGVDCTQSRVQAKLEHYGPHLAALLRPIVWSAYGRPTPRHVWTVLRSLSKSIARKRNIASAGCRLSQIALKHHTWDLAALRTTGSRLLARGISPGQPGSGCLAPAGGLLPVSGFPPAVSRTPGLWSPGASPSSFIVLSATGCPPALRICHDCPWRLTHHLGAPGAEFWRLSAHCTCCLLCSWLAAHFLPSLFGAPRPRLPHVPWR